MSLFHNKPWSRSRISLRRHRNSSAPSSPTPPLPPSLLESATNSPRTLSRQLSVDSTAGLSDAGTQTPGNENENEGAATETAPSTTTPRSTTPDPDAAEAEIATAIPGSYIKSESLGLSTPSRSASATPAPATAPLSPLSGHPLMHPSPQIRARSLSTGHPSPVVGNPRPLCAPVSPRHSPRPSPHLSPHLSPRSPQPRPLMPPGDVEDITPPDTADTCTFSPSDLSLGNPTMLAHAEAIPYLASHTVDLHPEFTTGDMILLAGDKGFRCHSGLLRAWSGVFAQQLKTERFARDRVIHSLDSADDVHAVLSFLYGRDRSHMAPGPSSSGLGLYGTLPSIQVEDAGFSLAQFRAVLAFADSHDVQPALRDLLRHAVDAEAKRLSANRPNGTDVLGLVMLAHAARSDGLWKELIRRAWPKPDGIGYRPPGPEWRAISAPHFIDEPTATRLDTAHPLLILIARVHGATGEVSVKYDKGA